jgi:hypothetical protein
MAPKGLSPMPAIYEMASKLAANDLTALQD